MSRQPSSFLLEWDWSSNFQLSGYSEVQVRLSKVLAEPMCLTVKRCSNDQVIALVFSNVGSYLNSPTLPCHRDLQKCSRLTEIRFPCIFRLRSVVRTSAASFGSTSCRSTSSCSANSDRRARPWRHCYSYYFFCNALQVQENHVQFGIVHA